MKDNSTGKTKGFYERGQAIFDRIPKMPEKKIKISTAEIDKMLAEYPRVKPTSAEPLENWYYLDEALTLHQLGKNQSFDDAYAEMEKVSIGRKFPFLCIACEDTVREWRAKLDRWLGDDKYKQKYKKREGDL